MIASILLIAEAPVDVEPMACGKVPRPQSA
jgi:hypothetical protein